MKKGLIKNIGKIALAGMATTTAVFADVTTTAAQGTVAYNITQFLNSSSFIIKAGAVGAALFGGYKVLLADGASGIHWFLLLVGGAFAGAYDTMGGIIVSFFESAATSNAQ